MEISKLGYNKKWLEYGFLTEELFNAQWKEFEASEDKNTQHFRYACFLNWLSNQKKITDEQVNHFFDLAKTDENEMMAGAALAQLYTCTAITEIQFDWITDKLRELGDWTEKLIIRESLNKRIDTEEITMELYDQCMAYKKEFKDNRLIIRMIKETNNIQILSQFETNGSGKQLRKLAQKKMNKLIKSR